MGLILYGAYTRKVAIAETLGFGYELLAAPLGRWK